MNGLMCFLDLILKMCDDSVIISNGLLLLANCDICFFDIVLQMLENVFVFDDDFLLMVNCGIRLVEVNAKCCQRNFATFNCIFLYCNHCHCYSSYSNYDKNTKPILDFFGKATLTFTRSQGCRFIHIVAVVQECRVKLRC